jgi:hypothetical protein
MSRPDRPQLGWKRPPEWDRFEGAVEGEYGATSPYRGFVLERAWREYRDDHPAEEYVDRLLRAVGSRGRPTREKNLSRSASVEDDRQVWVSVSQEIKGEMERFATEAGVPNHEVLRAVVCWYLDGGLLGRLTEKLERAVPEAEEQLADLDGSADASLGTKERRTVELVRGLGEGAFTRDDFREELREVRGTSDSPYCRDEYLPRVLDRLDFTPHPNNPDLFVPEEQAREYADDEDILDGPAIDRLPYADLTDEEQVYGLRVEAVRKAEGRTNGRYALRVEEVRGEVFDGGPSKRRAKALMDRATQASGFSTDARGGGKRLKVDVSEVDHGLLPDAGLDRDDGADSEGPDGGVAEQMDALTDATPVTDGGREDS